MSDNPNTFAALNAVREAWQTQLLSKATFTAFDDGMLLAAQDMLHGVEYGALGLIMTTDEWEAMPLNARDDGTFKPFPRPPVVPDMPQPLDANANPAAHAVYMRVLADIKVAEGRRHAIMSADSALKEVYRSAIIMGPENAAAAIGDGTVLEQMRDTARNMRARITAHLGTPDTATFDHWKKIYSTPASGMVVAEWIRLESLANKALTKHRRSLPEDLRMTAFIQCYEASPGVATCVREYKRTVPALENQSLPDLLAYVKAQQPNIELELTRSAVGYLSVQDETATPSTAAIATAPTMYTQAQVNALLAADRRTRSQAKSSGARPTLLYCWLHGYNQSHVSADCRGCEPGASMYKRYGTRDDGRCFSHANCQHDPPCISSAEAKRATKPESYPETPGSTYEWRARGGAATTARRSA
jgi:hypothetical protein